MLIAHRTVREIADLVDLTVEEVTHELEGYVLCASLLRGRAPAPMRACHTATLRGVDSPPRSGLPSDQHTSDCTRTTIAAY